MPSNLYFWYRHGQHQKIGDMPLNDHKEDKALDFELLWKWAELKVGRVLGLNVLEM